MKASARNGAIATVIVVVGHVLVFMFLSYPWARFAESDSVTGILGLAGSEVLRTVPHFGYFLLAGLALGHVFGVAAGVRWALVSAALAMALDSQLQTISFPDGIDEFGMVILGINYGLPPILAVLGAVASSLWRKDRGTSIAT